MQFILPLVDEGRSQRHATTLHVMLAFLLFGIGIAGIALFFGFTVLSKNFITHGAYNSFLLFGIACLLVSIILLILSIYQKTWLRQKRNNFMFRLIELALLAISSVLFFINGWMMPALLFAGMIGVIVFAIIRERRGLATGHVLIDDLGITINSDSRTKKLPWPEIDNLIFRFGILTIECKDNTLIQRNIAKLDITQTDIAELPAFASTQIASGKLARPVNDW